MKIGFNTGRTDIIPFMEKIKVFLELGCNAIEFSMMSFEQEEKLNEYWDQIPWDRFSYCSVHALTHELIYKNDDKTKDFLTRLQDKHNKYDFDLVVIHPNLVEDWDVFSNYNLPFAFENMDHNQNFARDVKDMKEVFSNVDAKMVMDVNHCFTNDPTMQLANDFYVAFGQRIQEIHLSGYEKFHEPLYLTKQPQIINAIPDKNIPIIIESTQKSLDDIVNEYKYVLEVLNK